MKRIILLIIVFTFFLIGFTYGNTNNKNTKSTTISDSIPLEIGIDNTVLVCILKDDKGYDRMIQSAFKKHYSGNVEFVLENNFYTDDYIDISIYRFIFDTQIETIVKYKQKLNDYGFYVDEPYNKTIYKFSLRDRKERKNYTIPNSSKFLKKKIYNYIDELEKQRLKKI